MAGKIKLRGVLFFSLGLLAPILRGQEYQDLFKKAQQAFAKGSYTEAAQGAQAALKLAQQMTLTPKEDKARIAELLGEADCILGEFRAWNQVAASYKEMADGTTFQGDIAYLSGLANLGRGAYREALQDFIAAIEIARQRPEFGTHLGRYLVARADAFRALANFSNAEEDLKSASAQPLAPTDAALRLTVQADIERWRERLKESSALYVQAENAWKAATPHNRPGWARALIGQGEIALLQADWPTADKVFKQAEGLLQGELSSNPVLYSAQDAAGRYFQLATRDSKKAQERIENALSGRELNENKADVATSQDHLGRLYLTPGAINLKEAGEKLNAAAATRLTLLGAKHPDYAETLTALARYDRANNKPADAERHLAEALAVEQSQARGESLAIAAIRIVQGDLKNDQKQTAAAIQSYSAALKIQTQRLGANHPGRQRTLRQLALWEHGNQQDDEAYPLLQEWIRANPRPTGTDGEEVTLAVAEIQLGRKEYAEAEAGFNTIWSSNRTGKSREFNATLARNLADAKAGAGKLTDAVPYFESAAQNLTGEESARMWERAGDVLGQQKKTADAVKDYQLALDIKQKLRPAGDPEITRVRLMIAGLLVDSGQADQADQYMSPLLRANPNIVLPRGSREMQVVTKIGGRLLENRQFDKAELYLRVELASVSSPDAPSDDVNRVLVRLADACAGLKKNGEAADLYERRAIRDFALHRYDDAERYFTAAREQRMTGGDTGSAKMAGTLVELGDVYLKEKKNQEAGQVFQQARDTLQGKGPESGQWLAAALNGLGQVAQTRSAYQEASDLYDQADSELQKSGSVSRRIKAEVLFNRGFLAVANRNTAMADNLYQQCLDLAKAVYTPEDPPPVEQFGMIADYYSTQGRLDAAEKLYKDNLELRRKTFSEGSVEEAWGLQTLADFYSVHGRFREAAEAAERALSIFQVRAGPDSDQVVQELTLLGTIYNQSSDTPHAIQTVERSLEIGKRTGRMKRDEENALRSQLGGYYRAQADYAKSVENYKRLVELWQPEGMANPNLQTAMRLLAVSYEFAKDHRNGQLMFDQLHKALRNDKSEDYKLLRDYAEALRKNGQTKDADKWQKEADKLAPNSTVKK